MSSYTLCMTNTNVTILTGAALPAWVGTVHFDPQAIPNVVLYMAWSSSFCLIWFVCLLVFIQLDFYDEMSENRSAVKFRSGNFCGCSEAESMLSKQITRRNIHSYRSSLRVVIHFSVEISTGSK